MTEKNKPEEDKIDLAKLDGDAYSIFLKKILKGTNPWYFFKPILYMVSAVGLIFASMYAWLHSESKVEEQSKPTQPVIVIPNSQVSNAPSLHAAQPMDENLRNELKVAQETIEDLKKQNSKLRDELERKPSYGTCIQYGNELNSLIKRKEVIEANILWLLNPQLTQEQVNRGYVITTEIMGNYVKQAAEYRKSADDLQKQILAIQDLRKPC
jgi:hypothetical protein